MSDDASQERAPGSEPEAPPRSDRSGTDDRVRMRHLARLGALFAGFAHEIRNPLSTIGLNLQLVKEDLGEPDGEDPRDARLRRRLTTVESEVRRLQGILEQFLGFVRVPQLTLRPVDLNALLLDILEFVGPEIRGRGVGLRFFGDPAVGALDLDADQFRAVVVNLLRNALEACEAGDEILMRSRAVTDAAGARGVDVVVADTGAGMPPEVVAKVFEPYFSTKKSGTGLGLPTARRIVEQHGGWIAVDSEPGRGTQFLIHLPAEPAPHGAED